MKRFYICDIIGDGDAENPFRPSVADENVGWAGLFPADLGSAGWMLVIVATANHTKLRNKPGIDPLPDFPLDGKVSAINTATKNAMDAMLSRRGIPAGLFGNSDGYREVIRGIGRQYAPAFYEDSIDVADFT